MKNHLIRFALLGFMSANLYAAPSAVIAPLHGVVFESVSKATSIETWGVEPLSCEKKQYINQMHYSCVLKEGGIMALDFNGNRVALDINSLIMIEIEGIGSSPNKTVYKYFATMDEMVGAIPVKETVALSVTHDDTNPDRLTGSIKIDSIGVQSSVMMLRK